MGKPTYRCARTFLIVASIIFALYGAGVIISNIILYLN